MGHKVPMPQGQPRFQGWWEEAAKGEKPSNGGRSRGSAKQLLASLLTGNKHAVMTGAGAGEVSHKIFLSVAKTLAVKGDAAENVAPAAGGYVVQVSSQKSEADAQASYRALLGKYPSVLGSQPLVVKRVVRLVVWHRAIGGHRGQRRRWRYTRHRGRAGVLVQRPNRHADAGLRGHIDRRFLPRDELFSAVAGHHAVRLLGDDDARAGGWFRLYD
jgi:hypothetical protein